MDIQTNIDPGLQLNSVRVLPKSRASQMLLDDIDALFDQLPGKIKRAVFDLKNFESGDRLQESLDGDDVQEEFRDEPEMDFKKEGEISGEGNLFNKEWDAFEADSMNSDIELEDSAGNHNAQGKTAQGGHYSEAKGEALDATRLYLQDIGRTPLLSAEEELHYARMAVAGNALGRKRMIESNLRLVVKIARRYLNRGLSLLDLVQEGNLGLMHAVKKFDPEKGFRFSTYAAWWIRQTIERALMSQVRTIRVPIHVMKELNQCLRAQRELSAKLQHEPTDMEVAGLLGRPLEEVSRLLKLNEHITSLDINIGEDGTLQLSDVIANVHQDDPQQLLCKEDMSEYLRGWLDHLNDKQRDIIARRFGLDGYEKKTLQRVGEDVGLTRERVRQIQVEALAKLRRLLEQNGMNKAVACVA